MGAERIANPLVFRPAGATGHQRATNGPPTGSVRNWRTRACRGVCRPAGGRSGGPVGGPAGGSAASMVQEPVVRIRCQRLCGRRLSATCRGGARATAPMGQAVAGLGSRRPPARTTRNPLGLAFSCAITEQSRAGRRHGQWWRVLVAGNLLYLGPVQYSISYHTLQYEVWYVVFKSSRASMCGQRRGKGPATEATLDRELPVVECGWCARGDGVQSAGGLPTYRPPPPPPACPARPSTRHVLIAARASR